MSRLFRRAVFLALTALMVLTFSVTALMLAALFVWWVASSFMADWAER